jgi:hypothetical protein
MSYEKYATENDFHISFNALYQLAKHLGVEVTNPANAEFITHCAEQMAEAHAQNRHLYSFLHPRPIGP